MKKKITIIGGGSSTFVPQLMRLFINSEPLQGSTIVLMDIDEYRLEIMDRLCRALVKNEAADLAIKSTTDQRQSLTGTDFCITAISVGGMDAWEKDIEIPAKYGVYMTIGDSVGPGGLARALRSIPVQIGIAEHMEKLCPDAWLVNITNPMATICLATAQATSIKTIGLCHELQGVLAILKNMLQLPEDVPMEMQVAGINHFIWLLSLFLIT